jgi:hypothetical protein
MRLPDREAVTAWIGATVVDSDGVEIGTCSTVFADDATGASEWLAVVLPDGRTAMVPVGDAREEGGTVHVAFTRARIETAPAFGAGAHLDVDQEKRLYDHYGIAHSEDDSTTVLPVDAPPRHHTAPAPAPAGGRSAHSASSSTMTSPSVLAPVAGIVGLVLALLGLRRLRARRAQRRQQIRIDRLREQLRLEALREQIPVEQLKAAAGTARATAGPALRRAGEGVAQGALTVAALGTMAGQKAADPARHLGTQAVEAAQTAGSAALVHGRAAASQTAATGRAAAKEAAKRSKRTGRRTGKKAAATGIVAGRSARRAATLSARGTRSAASSGLHAATAPVASGARRVRKTTSKLVNRTLLATGLGAGYVLGARSGRQPYEQLTAKVGELAQRPEVRQAQATVKGKAKGAVDALDGGSRGRHADPGSRHGDDDVIDLTRNSPVQGDRSDG